MNVNLHGVRLGAPDLNIDSHSLTITASSLSGDVLTHFALNARWEVLDFELPVPPGWASSGWRRVIDTSLPSPQDLVEFVDAQLVNGAAHSVRAHSVVVLFAGMVARGWASSGTISPDRNHEWCAENHRSSLHGAMAHISRSTSIPATHDTVLARRTGGRRRAVPGPGPRLFSWTPGLRLQVAALRQPPTAALKCKSLGFNAG